MLTALYGVVMVPMVLAVVATSGKSRSTDLGAGCGCGGCGGCGGD